MNPKLQTIINSLRDLAHDELINLANHVQSEAKNKDPEALARATNEGEYLRKYREEVAAKEAKLQSIIVKLRTILTPGTILKMRGCKDGTGLREFIKWEGDYLVCWQIAHRRQLIANVKYLRYQARTNQVTTHMADKVQQVIVNGVPFPIKSVLK